MFSQHFLDWAILAVLILLAIYTLIIIGSEGDTYEEDSREVSFFNLKMKVPNWWSEKEKLESSVNFHRADTFYEWEIKLSKISSNDINKYLEDYITSEEIIYDEGETQIETIAKNRILVEDTVTKIENFIWVEGTATEKINSRIFLELVLVQVSVDEVYFFENKSSVLNGAIEGPYFDELMKSLIIDS
jgi:hypothetical protein